MLEIARQLTPRSLLRASVRRAPSFRAIQETVGEVFPHASVAPALMVTTLDCETVSPWNLVSLLNSSHCVLDCVRNAGWQHGYALVLAIRRLHLPLLPHRAARVANQNVPRYVLCAQSDLVRRLRAVLYEMIRVACVSRAMVESARIAPVNDVRRLNRVFRMRSQVWTSKFRSTTTRVSSPSIAHSSSAPTSAPARGETPARSDRVRGEFANLACTCIRLCAPFSSRNHADSVQ